MGIFKKKYDLEKDGLYIRFDADEGKYVVSYGPNSIPYNSLNRKTKKILDERNNQLLNDSSLLQQELKRIKDIKRFNKLSSMGYLCHSFEYLGENNGTMSKQMEEYLSGLISEEGVLLGIHRIGDDDSPSKISDILTNGLIMTGHMGGFTNSGVELGDNVGYYMDNSTIIKELMYANEYKNSKGSILIRIPDSDLTGNLYVLGQNGETRLNPKYILGYIPLEPNHHISKLVKLQKQNVSTDTLQPSYSHSNGQELYTQGGFDYEDDEGPRMRR